MRVVAALVAALSNNTVAANALSGVVVIARVPHSKFPISLLCLCMALRYDVLVSSV